VQAVTKIKKRQVVKASAELKALNSMRLNQNLHDAINAYIIAPHLTEIERNSLRAVLAVLSQAPLTKKLLASL
jgi:hypothetical protein